MDQSLISLKTEQFSQIFQRQKEKREIGSRRNILMSTNIHCDPNFQRFVPNANDKQMLSKLIKIEKIFIREKQTIFWAVIIALSELI